VLEAAGNIHQLLFTPNSERITAVCGSDLLQVWSSSTGALQFTHPLPTRQVWKPLTLSPDGTMLVTRTNQVVELRSVVTGELMSGPFKSAAPMMHAVLSPDGLRLATGASDGTAQVWDAGTGKPLGAPLHHGQPLHRIVWSCDGRWLATVSQDRTVRVWDAEQGQPLTPLLQDSEPIQNASFSRDGSRLVTVGKSGSGRVWDLTADPRPVADLQCLTELLSGQSTHSNGGFVPVGAVGLRKAWPMLRARYPREFSSSTP
jgi:WD40 repeat protein